MAIPTKLVVPNPTITVAIPTKSSLILAAYTVCWFANCFIAALLLSRTERPVPTLGEYVNLSPVSNPWFLI